MEIEQSNKENKDSTMLRHWRAWGSWYSWGSPVGIALGFFLVAVGFGLFLFLLHLGGYAGGEWAS